MCYPRNYPYQHDHHTSPTNKADTEAYKRELRSKKRAPAKVRETKVDVSIDELSKLKDELSRKMQDIKRSWVPTQGKDKDKDKDKEGKLPWKEKGDGANEVSGEEKTATNDAP